eukprot:gene21775-26344_t
MFAILFYYQWFMSAADGGTICSADPNNTPSTMCLQNISDWSGDADPEVLRQGREQLAIYALAVYCVILYGGMVIHNYSEEDQKTDLQRAAIQMARIKEKSGLTQKTTLVKKPEEEDDDEDELPPSESFKPFVWRRASYFLLTILVVSCLMINMEFSYSSFFGDYVYYWLIGFDFMYQFLDMTVFEVICPDKMHYMPLTAGIGCTMEMTSFGAPNFAQFLLSGFVSLLISFLLKLYFNPALAEFLSVWPRWQIMLRRRF